MPGKEKYSQNGITRARRFLTTRVHFVYNRAGVDPETQEEEDLCHF